MNTDIKIDKDGIKYYKTQDGYFSSANERLLALKRIYPVYSIETVLNYVPEIVSWHAITTITIPIIGESPYQQKSLLFTGHSCKKIEDTMWGKFAAEVAETCSTARAIAKMGIGIAYGTTASIEEIDTENTFFISFPTKKENKEEDKSIIKKKELNEILKKKINVVNK